MGLDILPKSGGGFHTNYGAGNFKDKFNKLTSYGAGEFGMLKDNRKAIFGAISKRADAIKLKGGLDRMQRANAFSEITKSDKTLTSEDKDKIKELLKYYTRGKKISAPGVKAPVDIQRDDPEKALGRVSHVSNPNFFREGNAARRGEDAGNQLKYQKMQRLGSSDTARKLQKNAFSKLQESAGPGMVSPDNRDRGGIDLIKSL